MRAGSHIGGRFDVWFGRDAWQWEGTAVADLGWRKPIELFIDQQVLIDTVSGGEHVAEFSALTEVDTFEQRGEDLYLEGHILFSAFLDAPAAPELSAGPEQEEGAGGVRQIQHRMPFDLTLPVAAQGAGTLNVTVEVADAVLDVLGPGWIHIRALLTVDGLAAGGGYTAHCGAQEAVVAPAPPPPGASGDAADSALQASPEPAPGAGVSARPEAAGVRSAERAEPADGRPPTYERLFGAGAAAFGQAPPPAPGGGFAERESSLSAEGWKSQLEDADRALHGPFSPFRTGRATPAEEAAVLSAKDPEDGAVAHFHMEGAEADANDAEPEQARGDAAGPDGTAATAGPGAEAETAARTEWNGGVTSPPSESEPRSPLPPGSAQGEMGAREFADADGAVAAFPLWQGGAAKTPAAASFAAESSSSSASAEEGVQTSYNAIPEAPVEMTAAEWFWKTMGVPAEEARFTMKFRIVQEAETLEEIAQVYRVSAAELQRANQLRSDVVETGDLLYIPLRA